LLRFQKLTDRAAVEAMTIAFAKRHLHGGVALLMHCQGCRE
jgi:hypothetical protein